MAKGLAIMLSTMNIDDRAETLGGMQQNTAEILVGVWELTGSVLLSADYGELGIRLGRSSFNNPKVRRFCAGPVGISRSINDGQLNLS